MSLLTCPECGHDVSLNAVACPNCGRPIAAASPVVERKVVVMPPAEGGFPTWAFIPIGLLSIILLVVIYMAFRQSDVQANTNANANANRGTTEQARDSRTSTVPSTEGQSVTVPPTQTTTVPGTATAPPVAPLPDKGTVVLSAKIVTNNGGSQAARNAKFYLLDKDLESVLSEARLEPIAGNTLTGSLGLALVYPDRYGDFQRRAMQAIAAHAKYSGTTNGSGSSSLSGIAPNAYYLYGITRVGRGFALWNSPVSVIAGQNILNLAPQNVTDIPEPSGE